MNNFSDKLKSVTRMMKSMTQPESAFKLDFVPVIFANGEDDDSYGLMALFNNERVQVFDNIAEPNIDVYFDKAKFAVSQNVCLSSKGVIHGSFHDIINSLDIMLYNNGRHCSFKYCSVSKLNSPRM